MATLSSRLVVSLIDGITAPAAKAARGLMGIPKAVKTANGQMSSFGDRMSAAIRANNDALERSRGRVMEAVGGFYALKGAFGSTAGAAMALEDKMADIAKVSGMSEGELKAFEGRLRKIATNEIPMAVEELGELAAAAAQSGIANADLEEFTKMAAKSGVAWGMSGAQTGEALAKIKTALGLTIDETRTYADVINYLSDSTASSANDLVEYSRRVAADGKVAGFSSEQVLAFGAAMISSGAEADVAATSFRNVGRMLSRGDFGAKKSQIEAFGELGLSAEKVAKAMQVDASGTLITVLEAIEKAEPHKKLAIMSGIFGDEARALMPLLGELDSTRRSLNNVADATNYLGSVQKEFETRSKTGSYALQRFRNQVRDVAIAVGQSLLPAMKEILQVLGPVIMAVSDMIARNPKLVAGIFATVGALVALRVALAALTFIGLMGRGGALSVIAFGAAALGKTVGGIYAAARASIALRAACEIMAGGGKLNIFQMVISGARGAVMAIPGMSKVASAVRLIGVAFRAAAVMIAANPIGVAIAALAGAAYLIYQNWDAVQPYFQRLWDGVKGIFSGFYEYFAGIFTLDFTRAIDGLKTIFTSWNDIGKAMFDAGVALLTALWDGMKSIADRLKKWVGDLGTSIAAPFKNAASSVSGWFGSDDDGGGVDGARASGGPVSAGSSYLVGEKGPEIITPSKNGYVHANGSGPNAAGGGNVTIAPVFSFTGMSAGDADAIERRVREVLNREMRSLMGGVFADTGLRHAQ